MQTATPQRSSPADRHFGRILIQSSRAAKSAPIGGDVDSISSMTEFRCTVPVPFTPGERLECLIAWDRPAMANECGTIHSFAAGTVQVTRIRVDADGFHIACRICAQDEIPAADITEQPVQGILNWRGNPSATGSASQALPV